MRGPGLISGVGTIENERPPLYLSFPKTRASGVPSFSKSEFSLFQRQNLLFTIPACGDFGRGNIARLIFGM